VFKGNATKGSGQFVLNCEANSHGITVKGPPHSANASYTLTLPNDDGTSGQSLITDGNGVTSWATASGGGGASASDDLYVANPSSATSPTATGPNSVAIGSDAQATSTNGSIAFGQATRATGNSNAAIGFQANASGVGALSIGYTANAAASFSTAVGYSAKTATGSSATALTKSYASGADSFAAAIANNTSSYGATGGNSVAIGYQAKATHIRAISLGGNTNLASGIQSAILGGGLNTASGTNSIVIAGGDSVASNTACVASGAYANATIFAQEARSSGRFSALGDAQASRFVLRSDTTSATPEALTTNNSTAAATNQIVAASDTCITFSGTIVAMQNGAQSYGSWKIEGLLVNDGGTTTVPNSAITVIHNSSSWGLALSADNTNNALTVQVTGEASHNIRWVANIQTAEVTFA